MRPSLKEVGWWRKPMKPMRILACSILVLILSSLANAFQDWNTRAFAELSKTPNAVTWAQWQKLQDFEKQALYETRYIKRLDARQAYYISQIPGGAIISVDEADYYARQRIEPSINAPFSKFSKEFVQANLKFFAGFKFLMIYCR
jgi:hypothetical protein